jgi:hypothetical protein
MRPQQRAEEQQQRAKINSAARGEQQRQAEELRVEMLRLQLELERYKKWYYGPRADRLQSSGDVAQMLLAFAEELDRKPISPDDVPPAAEPAEELRRVRRRKGRRNLANFENIPVTTHVHELSAEERACPCCGAQRKEIGADEELADRILSRPLRTHPARAQEVRLPGARSNGAGPQHQTAAKPERRSRRGWPGRGCWLHRDE